MNFINKKINSFINPLYSKFPVEKKPFVHFVNHLIEFNQKINFNETEEHNKNLLRDFLKSTLNSQDGHNFYINTSEQIDLAIHSDNSSDSPIAVIIEVKKPDNNYEMVTADNFYKKSFYELMLYYLREKIIKNNHSVKFLIITNLIDWFIFNSHDFERLFARNRTLLDDFKNWHSGGFDSTSTNHFYSKIAPDFLKNTNENIDFVHFSLKDFLLNELKETDISQIDLPEIQRDKLIELYKLLSPVTLLGVKFANDSNSLNKDFYNELLYILGLEEQTENGKKIINRLPPSKRINGTIIENTIEMILSEREEEIDEYLKQNNLTEKDKDEAVFSIALELVITWLNRILFLKLLEGQLVGYHNGNTEYKFLTKDNIEDYGVLNELFFDVLAVPIDSRKDDIKTKFANIPYLNSSLFEKTKFENDFIGINQLKNRYTIPVYAGTVLKDEFGNNIVGKQNTLNYLFDFLDAYDFSNVSNEKILEKNKTLINASVLGLIFEKINGYKDGSYFTPGFISMYTARETIRRIVLQKFNDKYNWNCNDFDDISNFIISNKNKQQILEYNSIINSITICDPAVGSGHFLVSCLNELIACKSDLGILADANGKILQIKVHIENDELIFTDFEGNLFEYNPKNQDSTYIQKSIFFEKQNLIENCIFGVDINSKSTQISRLRLWIELLKNTYYNENNQLETLPNIDINIKTGNSLISNYSLNSFTSVSVKDSYIVSQYKEHVKEYKNTINSKKKKQLLKDIENDKNNLKGFIISKSELELKLKALNEEYHQKYESQTLDIELSPEQKIVHKEKQLKLLNEIGKIAIEINKIKDLLEDKNKLEWRFEFPEVLDDLGNFLGFDIVIGNPPYISTKGVDEKMKTLLKSKYGFADDTYNHFFFKSMQILKQNGILSFITSKTFWTIQTKKNLRELLLKNTILQFFDTANPFENAMVDTCITIVKKEPPQSDHFVLFFDGKKSFTDPQKYTFPQNDYANVPNKVFFIPTDHNKKIYDKLGRKVNELLTKWWDKISTSKNIEKNKIELETYRNSLQPGDITLLGLITEGGQGLATANNGKYIGVLDGTKWAENVRIQRPEKLLLATEFCKKENIKTKVDAQQFLDALSEQEIRQLFDNLKEKQGRDIFGQGWLYRIVHENEIANVDLLTDDEKLNGIQSKRTFVPYDKGDKDGNRWYAPTPYYIDWSRENVKFLKENSGKKGEGMPVVRNPQFYFREGFCWTDVNSTYLKARVKENGIYDVLTMSLFSITTLPDWYFVCLINSKFISEYVDHFVNSTSHFQINDARQLPIIIPSADQLKQFEGIFNRAYNIQKSKFEGKIIEVEAEAQLNMVQKEMDEMVEGMYI